jgi:ATPase subunit of ABC transporter with duplicated ATPase domains
MISFSNINKQYGKQLVFVDASFQLNPGEKVGLVGPNGAGKTTLFRMIVREESPDEGEVSVPKKLTIGYFRQDVEEMKGRPVLDEAIAGSGRVGDLHHELEDLHRAMNDPARADDMDRVLARFGEVQEEYEHLGGYRLEAQAREVLHGLGFEDDQIDGDAGALSGGWKMRVALARVLLGRPDVLLMDEPTNHLDIESIIWLEQFLKSYPGAILMTSHDREFMNRVVSKIAEIDAGEIVTYSGDYDFYERERAIRETNQQAAFARQQSMLAKEQRFIDRFKTHAAKAAQVQSRIKALDKIEKIELPKKRQVVKFEFRAPQRSGDQVAVIEDLHKSYGARVIYDGFNLTIRRGERWAVMGRNGHAAEDDCGRQCGGCRQRAAGRQPEHGILRAAVAGRAGSGSERYRTASEGLSAGRAGRAAYAGGRVSVFRRRCGQAHSGIVGRREVAAGHGAAAVQPAELPGAGRTHQSPGRGHQGNAGGGAE